MASLEFARSNPETVGPGVEALLREDLGLSQPIPFEILPGEVGPVTAKSVLKDIGYALTLASRTFQPFCYVHFTLDFPRPFQLQVAVVRFAFRPVAQTFAYRVPLRAPVAGEVHLGSAGFIGNPSTAAFLNRDHELIRMANKLAVSETSINGIQLHIPRRFQILPQDSGSLLILHRLGEPGLFSFNSATIGARNLFAFLPRLEALLSASFQGAIYQEDSQSMMNQTPVSQPRPRPVRQGPSGPMQMLYGLGLTVLGIILSVVAAQISKSIGVGFTVVFSGLIVIGVTYMLVGLVRSIIGFFRRLARRYVDNWVLKRD